MSELIIKLIDQDTYEHLHKQNYKYPARFTLEAVKSHLEKYGLDGLHDDSQPINIPIPKLSVPLTKWIENAIKKEYMVYLDQAELLKEISTTLEMNLQVPVSHIQGWSKYIDGQWVPCNGIESEGAVIDFETVKINGSPRPFMCSCIDSDGVVYSWLCTPENKNDLPTLVEFGEQIKLFIGHNSVSYDRRFIKEFYDFAHDKRMLDTYSFYHVVLGMSKDQSLMFKKFEYMDNKPRWARKTTGGSLAKLANFLCGIQLDKSVREKYLTEKKNKRVVKKKTDEDTNDVKDVFENYQIILENIKDIWEYCLKDSIATLKVFKVLFEIVSKYPSKIYIAGQLERSTLRIKVVPDIRQKIATVEEHNCKRLKEINNQLTKELRNKIKRNDLTLRDRIEGWLLKDWYERVYKSTSFPYKENLQQYANVELPQQLICCGWEEDESGTKRSQQKNSTLLRLKAVQHALNSGYKTKIQRGNGKKWLDYIVKPANTKIDVPHISLAGKDAPFIIGMKWKGYPLQIRGNTWGIVNDKNEFEPLPHPKGNENVGTPLSKEFLSRVYAKELTADIPLDVLFDNIAETTLWEKFQKRFGDLFIVNNTWLPEIVPSGTVTGRATGSLAVVLANTKYNRAGSEMKTWYRADEDNCFVGADYGGQESEIFAGHIDADMGHSGLNVYSCLVHAGKAENKTDIHSVVARIMTDTAQKMFNVPNLVIARFIGKQLNFANQFFCGKKRLGLMIYLGLKGSLILDKSIDIAKYFQELTRGVQSFGNYSNGMASTGFNRLKEMAVEPGQYCRLTGRKISEPLDARNVDNGEMTTRANFSIQGTGQGLIDVCAIVTRILCNAFNIPYNYAFLIHDELRLETHKSNARDLAYVLQIAHLFSKALMYYRFGVKGMPLNKMYFETVEIDKILRKSPTDSGVTPSQPNPLPHLWVYDAKDSPVNKHGGFESNTEQIAILKAEECQPSERLLKIIETKIF